MWYFTWILGVLLACAFGIINVLWLEAQESMDQGAMMLDPLTKLLARVEFLGVLENRIEQYKTEPAPFSLLMVNLDAMQRLSKSETSKHGNRMVLTASDVIKRATRHPFDSIARYDANTYAVILPSAEAATAKIIAGRICEKLAGSFPEQKSGSIVSIGVAEYPTQTTNPKDDNIQDQVQALLETTDKAVKTAQEKGENGFFCA